MSKTEYQKPVVVIVGDISGIVVLNFSCKIPNHNGSYTQIGEVGFDGKVKLESG